MPVKTVLINKGPMIGLLFITRRRRTALSGFCSGLLYGPYSMVSFRQNLNFSVGRVFEYPDFEFELDFDRQTPHSKSGQNPDSAVHRRLVLGPEPSKTSEFSIFTRYKRHNRFSLGFS